jgi:hypothetical protein
VRIVLLGLLTALAGCDAAETAPAAEFSGECEVTGSSIPLGVEIDESSGVAVSRAHAGLIWTHNDSGGGAELFAVDAQGRIQGRVEVRGSTNVDWEDIALAPCGSGDCLFIGDIGDNLARRDEVAIYRVAEPVPGATRTAPAERFPIRYPGGPRDAEALFVLNGDPYVVTKGADRPIGLFRYPAPLVADRLTELEHVRDLSGGPALIFDQVTGADASADGRLVAIRSYFELMIYRSEDLLFSADPKPIRVPLSGLMEPQGEGVALGEGGQVVLSSEGGRRGVPGQLSFLSCSFSLP